MADTAIASLRQILNGFRALNSKGIYSMNATETDLLRQILTEVQALSLGATVADGSITAVKLASDAVTTAKILNANITTAKIADSNITTAKIADSNITTAKIADSNITTAKIADSNVTPAKLSQPLTRPTAISLNGLTVADWVIPSWAKKITLMLNAASSGGTSNLRVRLGVGGTPETTGYINLVGGISAASNSLSSATAGFDIFYGDATYALSGSFEILNLSGNIWTFQGKAGNVTTAGYFAETSGVKSLAGVLDLIRLTTVSGDTFDAGSANIIYE